MKSQTPDILKDSMPIMTLNEVSELLRVHPNTLRNWDRDGILVAIRYGKRKDRRYKRDDVKKFLNTK